MKRLKWLFYFVILSIGILISTSKVLIEINKTNINFETNKASVVENKNIKPVLYLVKRVVDGDTIVIIKEDKEEKIRLIGVNTPESVDPRKKVECYGVEASNYTKENILNRYVYLETDETQSKQDKYGRTLAYIFRDDNFFLNKEIIKNGFGYEYTYSNDYKYKQDFKSAEFLAKQNGYGLWNINSCNKK